MVSQLRQDAKPDLSETDRIRVDDPLYWQICEFLWDEAELLDAGALLEWHALLTPDIRYQVPVRINAPAGEPEFSETMFHLDETNLTIGVKMQRIVGTTSAWAENPQSRTRRMVGRIRAYRTATDEEYAVRSTFVLLRYRYDHSDPEFVSGDRRDRIRRSDGDWKIAVRTVFLDQTTLGTANLAIFL